MYKKESSDQRIIHYTLHIFCITHQVNSTLLVNDISCDNVERSAKTISQKVVLLCDELLVLSASTFELSDSLQFF